MKIENSADYARGDHCGFIANVEYFKGTNNLFCHNVITLMLKSAETKSHVKNFGVFDFFKNFQKSAEVENLNLSSGNSHTNIKNQNNRIWCKLNC